MSLFDVYIAVDWSGRSRPSPRRPSRDAVWLAEQAPELSSERYFRTRTDCRDALRARLAAHVAAERRVVVGWDFVHGFPRGFAAGLGLADDPPWRAAWRLLAELVEDSGDNRNNRFAAASILNERAGPGPGPFWGCPPRQAGPTLAPTSPGFPFQTDSGVVLANRRLAERSVPRAQPVWKLLGVGSVGSQTLLGIPVVSRLRHDPELAPISRVWPFETGFDEHLAEDAFPSVIHAEIWPGLAPTPLDPALIRDQAQVRAVVQWLAARDAAGELGALFAAPAGLSDEERQTCLEEEGWILGAESRE